MAQRLSRDTGAVVIITGATDLVADEQRAFLIQNGHPMMSRITGSGCMLSAMMGAFLAANPEDALEAAAAAVCTMGLCGEEAAGLVERYGGGTASLRMYLIDAVSRLNGDRLEEGAKIEAYA